MSRKIAVLIHKEKSENLDLAPSLAQLRDFDVEAEVINLQTTADLALAGLDRQKFERALVCGGDGTLHRVVEDLVKLPAEKRIAVGVVPMGTANDFAKSTGMVAGSGNPFVAPACAPLRRVDVGWVNDRPFINVVSGGAVAQNTTDVSKNIKQTLGRYAYYFNAIVHAAEVKELALRFSSPDWSLNENSFAFAVGNSVMAGGGFKVAPEAVLNDGELDLLVIPSQSLLNLAALATELLKEAPDLSNRAVHYRQLKEFQLSCDEDLQINLDGEPMTGKDFSFRVSPKAIQIAVADDSHLAGPSAFQR